MKLTPCTYRGIPCLFNESTNVLRGVNIAYDMALSLAMFYDSEVRNLTVLPLQLNPATPKNSTEKL